MIFSSRKYCVLHIPSIALRLRVSRNIRLSAQREIVNRQSKIVNQSGIFPCFLAGLESRLLLNISSALIKRGRVSFGSITSSM